MPPRFAGLFCFQKFLSRNSNLVSFWTTVMLRETNPKGGITEPTPSGVGKEAKCKLSPSGAA
jgi:hypothetical protein